VVVLHALALAQMQEVRGQGGGRKGGACSGGAACARTRANAGVEGAGGSKGRRWCCLRLGSCSRSGEQLKWRHRSTARLGFAATRSTHRQPPGPCLLIHTASPTCSLTQHHTTHAHSNSHTHTCSLSKTHTHAYSRSITHTLAHSLSNTHTLAHSLSNKHTHTQAHSCSITHTCSHPQRPGARRP